MEGVKTHQTPDETATEGVQSLTKLHNLCAKQWATVQKKMPLDGAT